MRCGEILPWTKPHRERKSVPDSGLRYRLYHVTSAFIRLDDLRAAMIVDLPVISITIARTPVAQPTRRRRRISPKEGTDRFVALTVVLVKPPFHTLGSQHGN
jgi:hypothetical protein